MVNPIESPAVTAAAALAVIQSRPPHARPAPLPVVETPVPLVRAGDTVMLAARFVGVNGDVPKLFVPPGIVLTFQPTSTLATGVTFMVIVAEVDPQPFVTV